MPTTLDHGIVVMSSDLEPADLYGTDTRQGESVNNLLASVVGANRTFAANATFTNPTTNTLLSAGADKTALTTSLEKLHDGTLLEVHFAAAMLVTVAASTKKIHMGLRIGGVDYDMATTWGNATTDYRGRLAGHLLISGVDAGTLTIEPFVRTDATTTVQAQANIDHWSYTVREM